MVSAVELTTSDFPAAVDTTPIVRVRFPARRYSFDGAGNLVIRERRPQRVESVAASGDHAQEQSAAETTVSSTTTSVSGQAALTEAIAGALRGTSLALAAVEPMARTLSALSGDLTVFDRAAKAQLENIDMPSASARSLLWEAIRSLARFTNITNGEHVVVIERPDAGPAMRISPVYSRPFRSSSGSGTTTWQTVVQEEDISHPPTSLKCDTGHLFIHRKPTTGTQTCWMNGKSGKWELVTEGAEHPFIRDRVLHFRAKGKEDPSWITRATEMTTRARSERRETPGHA